MPGWLRTPAALAATSPWPAPWLRPRTPTPACCSATPAPARPAPARCVLCAEPCRACSQTCVRRPVTAERFAIVAILRGQREFMPPVAQQDTPLCLQVCMRCLSTGHGLEWAFERPRGVWGRPPSMRSRWTTSIQFMIACMWPGRCKQTASVAGRRPSAGVGRLRGAVNSCAASVLHAATAVPCAATEAPVQTACSRVPPFEATSHAISSMLLECSALLAD